MTCVSALKDRISVGTRSPCMRGSRQVTHSEGQSSVPSSPCRLAASGVLSWDAHTQHRVNVCYITCDLAMTHVRKCSRFQRKFKSVKQPTSSSLTHRPSSRLMGNSSRIGTGVQKSGFNAFLPRWDLGLACGFLQRSWVQPPRARSNSRAATSLAMKG